MHMYAGFSLGRLRQEEFDPKMNDENLSKCLQSLRHLYEDLAKKVRIRLFKEFFFLNYGVYFSGMGENHKKMRMWASVFSHWLITLRNLYEDLAKKVGLFMY